MSQYSGWGHFGFHWITPFHNIAGMLTESASAKLATRSSSTRSAAARHARVPVYAEQTTFPNPWPGGWWRLRDIVERQKVSAWATLTWRPRNKETVLWNAYLKSKRQTERGAAGKPAAYVISRRAARPADRDQDGQQAARAGRGGPSGEGRLHRRRRRLRRRLVRRADGAAEDGCSKYLLGRTFYPTTSGRAIVTVADAPVRHGDRHDVRVHGRARGTR